MFCRRHAHLLGNRHEQIVEDFEHHRVGMGADGARASELLHPAQHQMVLGGQRGLPAVLDHNRLMRLDNDGGSVDLVTRQKRVARINQGTMPFAVGEELRALRRRRQLGPADPVRLLLNVAPPPTASTETASIT